MNQDIKLFIEQVVQQELAERAISSYRAENDGLAIYISDNELAKRIILYRPSAYLEGDDESLALGIIEIEPNDFCNAWQVIIVGAVKGYGPLMYDIAFSIAGHRGLMADRENVSYSARKVWRYNFTTRSDDFIITHLDDQCTHKPTGENEENPLDFKYVAKSPIALNQLEKTHDRFVQSLEGWQQTQILTNLDFAGADLFRSKYRS